MGDELEFYTGFTLVDITATGVTRFRPEQEYQRNQQRNWETIVQTLGLRSQPLHLTGPASKVIETDLWKPIFGEFFDSPQRVWVFTWAVDREDIYLQGNDRLGALKQDFEQIPVITDLEETAKFLLPIFYPHGALKNIHFEHGRITL